jgi:hypothetical protein
MFLFSSTSDKRVGIVVTVDLPAVVSLSPSHISLTPYRARLLLFGLWGWSGTKSTITVAIYWHIVPALDDRWR